MADKKPAPVKPEFAAWYTAVEMGNDSTRQQLRWNGLNNLIKQVDDPLTETLIALAFDAKPRSKQEVVLKVRETFKAADGDFEMSGNDRELQVLSGAALAVLFDKASTKAAYAALAVTTAALGGARKADLPLDLVVLAENAIASMAEKNRRRPDLTSSRDAKATKVSFEVAGQTVKQTWNQEGVANGFNNAADAMNDALAQQMAHFTTLAKGVSDFITMQDEELQMLWWLFGGRSAELDRPFDALGTDAQAFIFASELASMTAVLPGPVSAKAILSRAGVKEKKKLTVPDAVNACEVNWLDKQIAGNDPSPLTEPLHFAIKRKLETGEDTAWIAGWAAVVSIDAKHSLSALSLSNYFYRERLLREFAD